MSVHRYDLNTRIGCKICVNICPMDVFRYNDEARKSVIAYPENCQSCGQCFVNCPGRSLCLTNDEYGYGLTAYRAATNVALNRKEIEPAK